VFTARYGLGVYIQIRLMSVLSALHNTCRAYMVSLHPLPRSVLQVEQTPAHTHPHTHTHTAAVGVSREDTFSPLLTHLQLCQHSARKLWDYFKCKSGNVMDLCLIQRGWAGEVNRVSLMHTG